VLHCHPSAGVRAGGPQAPRRCLQSRQTPGSLCCVARVGRQRQSEPRTLCGSGLTRARVRQNAAGAVALTHLAPGRRHHHHCHCSCSSCAGQQHGGASMGAPGCHVVVWRRTQRRRRQTRWRACGAASLLWCACACAYACCLGERGRGASRGNAWRSMTSLVLCGRACHSPTHLATRSTYHTTRPQRNHAQHTALPRRALTAGQRSAGRQQPPVRCSLQRQLCLRRPRSTVSVRR
jgi:hypothetical protein